MNLLKVGIFLKTALAPFQKRAMSLVILKSFIVIILVYQQGDLRVIRSFANKTTCRKAESRWKFSFVPLLKFCDFILRLKVIVFGLDFSLNNWSHLDLPFNSAKSPRVWCGCLADKAPELKSFLRQIEKNLLPFKYPTHFALKFRQLVYASPLYIKSTV